APQGCGALRRSFPPQPLAAAPPATGGRGTRVSGVPGGTRGVLPPCSWWVCVPVPPPRENPRSASTQHAQRGAKRRRRGSGGRAPERSGHANLSQFGLRRAAFDFFCRVPVRVSRWFRSSFAVSWCVVAVCVLVLCPVRC